MEKAKQFIFIAELNVNGKFEVVFEDEEKIATETDIKVYLFFEK